MVLRALRSAASTGLLVAYGTRLRWRHALIRDAVLATLLPPAQAVLARRAAAEMSARGGRTMTRSRPSSLRWLATQRAQAGRPELCAPL
jgi:hypothetical protein